MAFRPPIKSGAGSPPSKGRRSLVRGLREMVGGEIVSLMLYVLSLMFSSSCRLFCDCSEACWRLPGSCGVNPHRAYPRAFRAWHSPPCLGSRGGCQLQGVRSSLRTEGRSPIAWLGRPLDRRSAVVGSGSRRVGRSKPILYRRSAGSGRPSPLLQLTLAESERQAIGVCARGPSEQVRGQVGGDTGRAGSTPPA